MDPKRQITDEDFEWVCEGLADSHQEALSTPCEDDYRRDANSV